MSNMHELFHTIGLCPDTLTHPNLISMLIASYQTIPFFNYKNIKQYVTQRIRSRVVTTNK